jgi:hypothetical protein
VTFLPDLGSVNWDGRNLRKTSKSFGTQVGPLFQIPLSSIIASKKPRHFGPWNEFQLEAVVSFTKFYEFSELDRKKVE